MDMAKVRMKIGEHEFEAEGTPEGVQSQFEAFRLILSTLDTKPKTVQVETPGDDEENKGDSSHVRLDRIMKAQGRVVSLTALPAAIEDAALLILLGNREMRDNEAATGGEIGDGLAQSGRPVDRVDRIVSKLIADAFVLKSGIKRSSRYRLSNLGHQKALAVARELIATLPQ